MIEDVTPGMIKPKYFLENSISFLNIKKTTVH